MKKIILVFTFFPIVFQAISQEEDSIPKYWNTKGMLSLNVSQVSFKNWSAGGVNSVTYNSFVNFQVNYKKDNISWENNIPRLWYT